MIFLIDLDGTLIDSDDCHVDAWSKVLRMNPLQVEEIINTVGFENYLKDCNFKDLRSKKFEEIYKIQEIELIKNADKFIDFINEYDINHVVVTNTDESIVEHFKSRVPILNNLKNWVVREDYSLPKPDPECYKLALDMYGNNDTNIIGFENSTKGLKSIRHVTNNTFKISKHTDYSNIIKRIKVRYPKRFVNMTIPCMSNSHRGSNGPLFPM